MRLRAKERQRAALLPGLGLREGNFGMFWDLKKNEMSFFNVFFCFKVCLKAFLRFFGVFLPVL